jgi:hypothetical protein
MTATRRIALRIECEADSKFYWRCSTKACSHYELSLRDGKQAADDARGVVGDQQGARAVVHDERVDAHQVIAGDTIISGISEGLSQTRASFSG